MGQVIKRLEFLEVIIFCGIFPQCCLSLPPKFSYEQGGQSETRFACKLSDS